MNLDATLDVEVDGTVTFTFRVTNVGTEPAELTFRSGQDGDVAVRQDGEEVWRWSDGRMFTQAIRTTTLAVGETYETEYEWTEPAPGDYTAVASLAVEESVEARAEFQV
ncbi:MAG: BsuPI-related putative proteinase inhibitor [Halovenus sp.]